MSLEADLLLQAAELAAERRDWPRARRFYDELLSTQPQHPEALLGLAAAQRSAGEAEAAAASLDQALAVAPERPSVLRALAAAAEATERPAEALGFWRAALAAAPQEAEAEAAIARLQAALPAALAPALSHRLVLARRAEARDAAVAAEHRRAVREAVPGLTELGDRPAPPPPVDGASLLERLLRAEAAPWFLGIDAAGLPAPPLALRNEEDLLAPPLLLAYAAAGLTAPAEAALALLPGGPDSPAGSILRREIALRGLARGDAADADTAAAALLPPLEPQASAVSPSGYFSPAAAWLRYRMRRGLLQGRPLPSLPPASLPLLCFDHDLSLALVPVSGLEPLLAMPVVLNDGGVFYQATDMCMSAGRHAIGIALATIGAEYFMRRSAQFKCLEMHLKRGTMLEHAGDAPAALAALLQVVEAARDGRLLAAAVREVVSLRGLDGAAAIAAPLARREASVLAEALSCILGRGVGSADGDMLKRRCIALLTRALAEGEGELRLPAIALRQPTLFGHMLSHAAATLPGAAALAKPMRQIAASTSGFSDVAITGQHLADLLQAGDRAGIAAIAAYLTQRHGVPLSGGRDGIVAVLGTTNVGDTILYLAGFAAFARASGQEITVLHRPHRAALTEFFRAIPNLHFAPLPGKVDLPAALALNRLAPGSVSLFYEFDWYREQEVSHLINLKQTHNFLWHKTAAVLLSGAAFLPERFTVPRPAATPPAAATEAARRRFAELGLKRGRTVFLSPLANTLFSLTASRINDFHAMWAAAIRLLRAHGFDVAMNAVNNGASDRQFTELAVPELDLDLRELPGFVAECGYFAGVRSGLNDLLAICGLDGVEARTIYMRGAEHCIGLADFGMSEVVADFSVHSPEALAEALFADWLR